MSNIVLDSRFVDVLQHLNRGGDYSVFFQCQLDKDGNTIKGTNTTQWYACNGVAPPVHDDGKRHIFFGINPVTKEENPRVFDDHRRNTIDATMAINAFFADLDRDKLGKTRDEVLSWVEALELKPSLLINTSGPKGNLHGFWFLDEPLLLKDEQERQQFNTDWYHAFAEAIGSDVGAKDIARVSRVVGSFNRKSHLDVPPEVTIHYYHPDRQYTLNQIDDFINSMYPDSKIRGQGKDAYTTMASVADYEHELEDKLIIAKARYCFDRLTARRKHTFSDLHDGKIGETKNQHDASYIWMLIMVGASDEQVHRIIMSSGMVRPKLVKRPAYIDRTINSQKVFIGSSDTMLRARTNMMSLEIDANGQQAFLSDLTNAINTIGQTGYRFSYVPEWGWLCYSDTTGHWSSTNSDALVFDSVRLSMQHSLRAAALKGYPNPTKEEMKYYTTDSYRIKSAIPIMSAMCVESTEEFDQHGHILNTPGAAIDLRSGEEVPERKGLKLTQVTNAFYNPAADYGEWEGILLENLGGDEEALKYLQVMFGYFLTGSTQEEKLFYLYGPPRAGKNLLVDTFRRAIGSQYSAVLPMETFTSAVSTSETVNFRIAAVHSSRFIFSEESNDFDVMNAAFIKRNTGGGSLQVAHKYKPHFEFTPKYKILIASNFPPKMRIDDDAAWSRLEIVNMPTSHLGKEDKGLKTRLQSQEHLEAVLNWAVDGAIKWYEQGLTPTETMNDTRADIRRSQDYVQEFINECCDLGDKKVFDTVTNLHNGYKEWNQSPYNYSRNNFSTILENKGYLKKRKDIGVCHIGIKYYSPGRAVIRKVKEAE